MANERAAAQLDPRMQPVRSAAGISVRHASGASATIDPRGAELMLGKHASFRLAVSSIERADGSSLVTEPRNAAPEVRGAEVVRSLGRGAIEWWRSLASGLEHGVTLATRPDGDGALIVKLDLHGAGARTSSASAVELRGHDGALIGRYGELLVTDATGAILGASMRVEGGRVRIDVDDHGARYPVVIDPLIRTDEAIFLGEIGPLNEAFGFAVAMSADGTRALVSAPGAGIGLPASPIFYAGDASVIVLVRDGGTWVEEARITIPADGPSTPFGKALALSEDGSVALIGAPSARGGSVHVYTRDVATWSSEAVLTVAGGEALDQLGSAVALSLDGNVALIGAPGAQVPTGSDLPSGGQGLAYVFERQGDAWIERATLSVEDPTPSQALGTSVALSEDGSVALIGASYTGDVAGNEGGAYVFERAEDEWLETAVLVAEGAETFDLFGQAVALSAAGDIALVGAPGDDDTAGSAHFFERAATTWTEVAVLRAPDGGTDAHLGQAVALSADGTRALLGAPLDDLPDQADQLFGSVYPATRASDTWTLGAALRMSEPEYGDQLGAAVALSGDGARALIGAPFDKLEGTTVTVGSVLFYEDDAGSYLASGQLMYEPEWVERDFGTAVVISAAGDRALIGAPGTSTEIGERAGQVRVLKRDGEQWSVEARLRASDAAALDAFGSAIAINSDADVALVGAPNDDTAAGANAGTVRVFVRQDSTWTEQQTLVAPDAAAEDVFGYAVALSQDGQYAIIGAPGKNGAELRGCAYVYSRSGGTFSYDSTLLIDVDDLQAVGIALAVDATGTRAVVNARKLSTQEYVPRVFVRDGASWTIETTLISGASHWANVGLSHAGDRAISGGSIVVRSGSTWSIETGGWIGRGMTISGDGMRAFALRTGGRPVRWFMMVLEREPAGWTERVFAPIPFLVDTSAAMTSTGDRALIGQWPTSGAGPGAAWMYGLTHFDVPDFCELMDCDAGTDEADEPDAELPDPLDASTTQPDSGLADAATPDAATPDASTMADAAVLPDAAQPAPNDGDASHPGPNDPDDAVNDLSSTCSCRVVRADTGRGPYAWGFLIAGLLALRVRRRTRFR